MYYSDQIKHTSSKTVEQAINEKALATDVKHTITTSTNSSSRNLFHNDFDIITNEETNTNISINSDNIEVGEFYFLHNAHTINSLTLSPASGKTFFKNNSSNYASIEIFPNTTIKVIKISSTQILIAR